MKRKRNGFSAAKIASPIPTFTLLSLPSVEAAAVNFQPEDTSLSDLYDGSSKVTNADSEPQNIAEGPKFYREDQVAKELETLYEQELKESDEMKQLEMEALRSEMRRIEEKYKKKIDEAQFESAHLKALLKMSEKARMAIVEFHKQEREENKQERNELLMKWRDGESALMMEIEVMKKEREFLHADFKAREERLRMKMKEMKQRVKELQEDNNVLLWTFSRDSIN